MKERLLICFLVFVTVTATKAHYHERLKYFETLNHVDVRVNGRQKRSVDGAHVDVKDVSFSAFGRNFNLVLTPGSPVLSSDLTARLVYGNGKSAPIYINENQFFTGHLAEDDGVKADAHTESGLWTANIYDKDEVYILEPSNGHLPPSDNHSMIVYKQSDIKLENIFPDLTSNPGHNRTICKSLHAEDDEDFEAEKEMEKNEREHIAVDFNGNRSRRATPTSRNTCHIIAVADYTFYHGPGGGFPHQTANYIIQTLQKVNRIFKETEWNKGEGLYEMGFQIKELRVHSEPTDASRMYRGLHYNMKRDSWPDEGLLNQFGEDRDLQNFCLAHLFTYRQFAGGVLGLAYIAPARRYAMGGICSVSRNRKAMNTGFSSAMNTKGNNLLTQEAVLVTTHEFGHNWGAEHDAETKECAPSSYKDGKFLMYPYAVSGWEKNNYLFSPCSKRYIFSALMTRSSRCFKMQIAGDPKIIVELSANVPMCGNGIIDKGEDCDGGSRGLTDLDPCCSKTCKFKGDAKCSPANYECCENCQMALSGVRCRGENQDQCKMQAFCNGIKLECPESDPFDNGTKCMDGGECLGGECKNFCHVNGVKTGKLLQPCRCDQDRVKACKRCCKSENSTCEPYQDADVGPVNLQNGRPCGYGYCEEGECKTAKVNMIKRIFSFIENLDSDTLVEFMKANIVGTIMVFSVFIWIPLSWFISCIDKRHDKKTREQDPWLSRDALLNMSMQSQQFNQIDDFKIRQPAGPFRVATDLKGRQYWTGAGPVHGGGGGDGGGHNNGGAGGGDGHYRGDTQYRGPPKEEKTYKPRGDGDGPMDFESTV